MKNIYHYHPRTGEYAGASVPDESPLEPGVYLIPDFATSVKPPKLAEGKRRVFQNGKWRYEEMDVSVAVEESATEPELTVEQLAAVAKRRRNQLLYYSDFTQLADVAESMLPEVRQAWRTYRQALRDITKQAGFPQEIRWPEKPL